MIDAEHSDHELLLECPECGEEKGDHVQVTGWKRFGFHLVKHRVISWWELKFYCMEAGMSKQEAYEHTVIRIVGGRNDGSGIIEDRKTPRDSAQRQESKPGHIESEGSTRGKEHRPYANQ